MTRRNWLSAITAAALHGAPARTTMGVATTSYLTAWKPKDTLEFLEHCHQLGAGGIQASLSSVDPGYLRQLRTRAEHYGMYLETMAPLPKQDSAQFEAAVRGAKEAGALSIRTACLSGRRYETFKTVDAWRAFVAESKASLERAVAVAERHKMRIAVENHKDWTAAEFVELLRQYPSEYLGVCLDTGNNLSLLDDPMEVVEALAPRAFATHIKDMNVAPYADGFLLSEVVFGEGFLEIPKMLAVIRRHRPEIKFTLEMITRDPLKIPCLTEAYWAPFPERNGRYLARALRMVERDRRPGKLPTLAGMDAAAQRRFEDDNVRRCLDTARTQYGLV